MWDTMHRWNMTSWEFQIDGMSGLDFGDKTEGLVYFEIIGMHEFCHLRCRPNSLWHTSISVYSRVPRTSPLTVSSQVITSVWAGQPIWQCNGIELDINRSPVQHLNAAPYSLTLQVFTSPLCTGSHIFFHTFIDKNSLSMWKAFCQQIQFLELGETEKHSISCKYNFIWTASWLWAVVSNPEVLKVLPLPFKCICMSVDLIIKKKS